MSTPLNLHPERLFSADPTIRKIAVELYNEVKDLPIISPHGHTDPSWFANNLAFSNPAELLIQPDHYVFRMLYSQGISLDSLGIGNSEEARHAKPEEIWKIFADHYYLFRGTPSRMWMDYVFSEVFGFDVALDSSTAEHYYQTIDSKLKLDNFKPRALFERFNIEVIATTENPLDKLKHHKAIMESDWDGKVLTAFRPDNVLDPEFPDFSGQVTQLTHASGENATEYKGYLKALANRREFFKAHGATSSDHGHLTPFTADLSEQQAAKLFDKALLSRISPEESELFRGHMLTKMADMSIDDGLVMQIHPGCYRNHNDFVFEHYGRDKGADLPMPTEYIKNLKALMDKHGNNPKLQIILFTLDETTYSRELAPLAGHYPSLKLGPAWWFHDSPEGMKRFRQQTMESAGFYNTVGFNDDTRAFMSIPARHDLARRIDCGFLAELVADHRLTLVEAHELAHDLSYHLAKKAYKL
ncbi:glucuronate isomerase [Glaciecola sp. MH2013]|uniref:glucuronate isomerase n=1 Tax=Glaciecola sp. MH2013 TaxID=2785524 RepID=UPI00189D9AD0|nr:glucuronate isomerase [Glaciecola sp. MH2013]MBF7073670.1 glucuronate isomerase [Glaciecola sp. MH2013]